MARQIVVELVSDASSFTREMSRAGESARETGKALGAAGGETETLGAKLKDTGASFGQARSQIKGTQSLLKGLEATLGANFDETISTLSGYANLAKGIKGGLVPALTLGVGKVKALTAAMAASRLTPYGIALTAVAAASIYVANETGNLNKVVDAGKGILSDSAKGWDMIVGKLLSVVGAAASASVSLEELRKQGQQITGPDPLKPPGGGVSVDDLANWNGSGSAGDWASKNAAERASRAGREAIAAANKAIGDSAAKGAKAAGDATAKAATAAAKALAKAFKPIESELDKALVSWKKKIDGAKGIRDSIRGLFKLDVKADAPGGLVAGIRKQAADMEKFVKVIAALRKKGFDKDLINSLVDRGPEALADATELSHVSVRDTNKIWRSVEGMRDGFSRSEAEIRTGVDPNKPGKVKVTLDVKGGDRALVNLIKKWVKEEGGGNVQVAFGK